MATKREKTREPAVVIPARVQRFSEELSGFLEGWRYVDSDVRVDGELVAELIGRIEDRLVFVHHLTGKKAEIVGETLKRVSSAESNARRLARQYRSGVGVHPLVVVIVEGKTKGLTQQLGALCPDPVMLFAERRLVTAGRRARFLEELTPALIPSAPLSREKEALAPEVFEESLARSAWDKVIARVDRIDSRLERVEGEDEVRWMYGDEALCCVAFDSDAHLFGRIGTDGVQHSLGSDRSLEVFLDWVLAHHIELTEAEDREGLRDVELMPHPSEPLLTPEELAAFQE
jgi:hypothetical protein